MPGREKSSAAKGRGRARPRAILAELGLDVVRVELWERGARNWHWFARTRQDGDVVLTRFAANCTLQEIVYQGRAMERVRTLGWPVPEILAGPAVIEDRVWWVARRLDGQMRSPRTRRGSLLEERARGQMLGRLHRETSAAVDLGTRPTWLPSYLLHTRSPPQEEVFDAWEKRMPEEVAILRAYGERASQLIEALDVRSLPRTLIHGDFVPWNLLYRGGVLTGVLDFEFSNVDARVAEFALSWRGRHDEIVRGYIDENQMDDRELAAITPVRWAILVDGARSVLTSGSFDVDLSWTMNQIIRRSPLMASTQVAGLPSG